MNPQFCSPLHVPLRPSFVPVVMRPSLPVWYTSTQDQSSPVHGVPLFPFGLTPEANFNSPTTIVVSNSKGNENLCGSMYLPTCKGQIAAVILCLKLHVSLAALTIWASDSQNPLTRRIFHLPVRIPPKPYVFSVSCNHECPAYHFVLSFLSLDCEPINLFHIPFNHQFLAAWKYFQISIVN